MLIPAPETLLRRADGWLFAPEDRRRLAAVRVGLCSLLALRLALTDHGAVAASHTPFHPVFYLSLLERMPSHEAAAALEACGIAAALVAAAGLALRLTLPLALVCSLVLNGMVNSAGRVIVGDAVLTLCLLLVAACGPAAGRERRARDRGARYGWPIRTAMVTISLAYFLAGLQKWRYSGIRWVTSNNLRLILWASSDHRAHPNRLALFVAGRPGLAHGLAAGSLLLETFFPLVLFVPALRWVFIPGVVAMHLGIRLAMGLDYTAQLLTVVIVFVNWPVVVDRVRRRAVLGPLRWAAPG